MGNSACCEGVSDNAVTVNIMRCADKTYIMGENGYQYVFRKLGKDNFSRFDIDFNDLNKYDKFYRIACNPLTKMNISDFLMDLVKIMQKI